MTDFAPPNLPGTPVDPERRTLEWSSQLTAQSSLSGKHSPNTGSTPRPVERERLLRRSSAGAFGQFVQKEDDTEETMTTTKPRQKCSLRSVVTSTWFDMLSTVLTFISAVVNACEVQYKGFDLAQDINFSNSAIPASEIWPGFEEVASVLDIVLGICFTIELTLKIGSLRKEFFKSYWNWLDFVCVSGWNFEKVAILFGATSGGNLITLRLVRLAKLGRVARRVKTIKALDSLQVLIGSIVASMSVLCWASSFLFIVHMLVALGMNGLLMEYMENQSPEDPEAQRRVYAYFGTFTRAMITTFELTMGNFVPVTRLLMESVNPWTALLMVAYKMIVGFAFVTVIRGVFMHETFKVAASDDDLMVVQKKRVVEKHQKQMSKLMSLTDENNDGIVTIEEFKQIMKNKQVRTWMAAMEVDVGDPEGLFELMDDGDGKLTLEEIACALSRLKGSARSIDLVAMRRDFGTLQDVLQDLCCKVESLQLHGGFQEVARSLPCRQEHRG